MIDALSRMFPVGMATPSLLAGKPTPEDHETRLAVSLQSSVTAQQPSATANPRRSGPADANGAEAKLRRVAAEIARNVEARLPGRVRELKVGFQNGQFVLSGVASSYYVKQVAQHLAMHALDTCMLGRLVNEIEVRTMR